MICGVTLVSTLVGVQVGFDGEYFPAFDSLSCSDDFELFSIAWGAKLYLPYSLLIDGGGWCIKLDKTGGGGTLKSGFGSS